MSIAEVHRLHGDLKFWKEHNGMNVMPRELKAELHPWYQLVSDITSKPAASFSFDQLQQLHGFSSFFAEGAPPTGLRIGTEQAYKAGLLPLIDQALEAHPDYKAYRIMRDYYVTQVPKLLHCMEELRSYAHFRKVSSVMVELEGLVRAIQEMDPNMSNYLAMNSHLSHIPLSVQLDFSPTVSGIFAGRNNAQLRYATLSIDTAANMFRGLHVIFQDGASIKPGRTAGSHEPPLAELHKDCISAANAWDSTLGTLDRLAHARSGRAV